VLGMLLLSSATLPALAKDVKIGLLIPLSGRYAETGISVRRGIEMILNDVNAAGGIKSMGGAKVNLVVADNGSDPTKTSLEARRLMTEEKVSFILGPYSTPESEAFRPIAERYKVGGVGLQTTMIPNAQYLTMLSLTADAFGKGYADFVGWLRSKGAKVDPVVITYANNDYGQGVAKSAQEALQVMGIKVIEAIRARLPDVPIMVVSVIQSEDMVIAAIRAGAKGYITKGQSEFSITQSIKDVMAGNYPISPSLARSLFRLVDARPNVTPNYFKLTEREAETLRLLSRGLAYSQVATEMNISLSTVQSHVRNLYRKLGVNSQAQAVAKAHQQAWSATRTNWKNPNRAKESRPSTIGRSRDVHVFLQRGAEAIVLLHNASHHQPHGRAPLCAQQCQFGAYFAGAVMHAA